MLLGAPARIDVVGPVIFLAGPIAWGPTSWHDRAIALITELAPELTIANPRRDPAASAKLWNRKEDEVVWGGADFPDQAYDEQMDWEAHYLRRAATHGVVLFWLAREVTHNCERPHAQTTRFELAESKERAAREGARLAVGIEEGFTGARYIRRKLAQDCPQVPLCTTLEDTCRAAIAQCR